MRQNIAGGSIEVGEPLNSVVLTGYGLADMALVGIANEGGEIELTVNPVISSDGKTATFSNLGFTSGEELKIKRGTPASTFLRIDVVSSGGGDAPAHTTVSSINGVDNASHAISNGQVSITLGEDSDGLEVVGTNMGTETAYWVLVRPNGEDTTALTATPSKVTFDISELNTTGSFLLKFRGTTLVTINVSNPVALTAQVGGQIYPLSNGTQLPAAVASAQGRFSIVLNGFTPNAYYPLNESGGNTFNPDDGDVATRTLTWDQNPLENQDGYEFTLKMNLDGHDVTIVTFQVEAA